MRWIAANERWMFGPLLINFEINSSALTFKKKQSNLPAVDPLQLHSQRINYKQQRIHHDHP